MPTNADDLRFTKLAADAAESVRLLKTLGNRLNRVEQALRPNKIPPDKLAGELTKLREQIKLLGIAQQKLATAAQESARRQADQEER